MQGTIYLPFQWLHHPPLCTTSIYHSKVARHSQRTYVSLHPAAHINPSGGHSDGFRFNAAPVTLKFATLCNRFFRSRTEKFRPMAEWIWKASHTWRPQIRCFNWIIQIRTHGSRQHVQDEEAVAKGNINAIKRPHSHHSLPYCIILPN